MEYVLIFSNIVMGGVFALRFSSFPSQIPLFYSHLQGEDQLGEWWMIFLLPIFLNIFFIVNKLLVKKMFHDNPFVQKMVHYLNLFLIIVITGIFLKIVLLIS